jgi:hypothetical protein
MVPSANSARGGSREQRRFARVETDLACLVDGSADCRIRNLSLGGALLFGPHGLAEVGDPLSIELKVDSDAPLAVLGEVLRVARRDTHAEHGIRFPGVDSSQHQRLSRCLSSISKRGGTGERASPRQFKRLGIRCRSVEDFYATMSNISAGGLGFECDVPLSVGETVTLEVMTRAADRPLHLTGVVAHTRKTPAGTYQAGLRFERLTDSQRADLEDAIRTLLREI